MLTQNLYLSLLRVIHDHVDEDDWDGAFQICDIVIVNKDVRAFLLIMDELLGFKPDAVLSHGEKRVLSGGQHEQHWALIKMFFEYSEDGVALGK